MLKLDKINAGYEYLHVVWDVSLEIQDSEMVAILGLNGAGKTTILKTIAGLKKPISGTITFNGENIAGLPPHVIVKKGIAFIPEERNLFSAMSVYENLIMGAYTVKDRKKTGKNLDYVFGLFPRLQERSKQLVGTMSGGERQMVAIARGLMCNPKLIILDEPSTGLSPQNVLIVFDVVKKLREEGVTVIIVEQNVNTTLKIVDRAYVMDQGRVVMEGGSAELMADGHVQKMYLGLD